jgi:ribosome maturation factor RimP
MAPQRGRAAGGRPADIVAHRRPGGDLSTLRGRLTEIVAPLVARAGYDLEELGISRVGRRHLVRVVVDADGGISLDAVAELSRRVSEALDAAEASGDELISGEYQLEVSSPGVDRPLTLPRHWRRNIGRLVRVHADDRQVTGRVTDADEERVTLDIDGEARRLAYGRLGPGRVQVEFSRPDGGPDEIDEEELEDEER